MDDMMQIEQIGLCILSMIAAFLTMGMYDLELRRDLMMFQQNSYRYARYRRWLQQSADTTSGQRICGYILFLLALAKFSSGIEWLVMTVYAVVDMVYILKARKIRYKKPLVWTHRASRIYAVAAIIPIVPVLYFLIFSSGDRFFCMAVTYMGFYAGSHLMVMLSNLLLTPVEKHITGKYYKDAVARIGSMPDLKVIGITGSYGKTSTKHFLERIVSEKYQVTMTPGSFNTTLGVVRTIRENLKPYDEVFIVEMGAKNRGDIKEICDLVHPSVGIITAVGEQHLESFKTIKNVQATKFELVDSLPADGGLAIVNNDFPYIADRPVDNTACLRYAVSNVKDADYTVCDIESTRRGSQFTLCGPGGYRHRLTTRLLGACNISNLAAAVIAARSIGVEDDKIEHAVAAIEPVEHRLSQKTSAGGVTVIDDAFNSNPDGASMALDVLSMMTPGKRIIITPGMIELGEREQELNRAFGEKIAGCADVAIIVGLYNRESIIEGIRSVGRIEDNNLYAVDTFSDAQRVLAGICVSGDTVLYENDLPDTFK